MKDIEETTEIKTSTLPTPAANTAGLIQLYVTLN